MIDAHQHFWHPARGDYSWMAPDDPVLARPYLPADLLPLLDAAGIAGTVLVQAAPTTCETHYMLGLADASPRILGVVGWIDFERPETAETLARLAAHPKLVGIRPMIQDLPDDLWMLRADVQWAYRALVAHDLVFDALGFPRHLAPFLELFQRYPDLRAVVDHCMKPQIRDPDPAAFRHWAEGIGRIARETSAFCKLSGLVTEAEPGAGIAELRPYVEHVLDAFGPDRVLWGSDWPVCRLRLEYDAWFAMARALTDHLSEADRAAIFGGTARALYRLA